MKLSKTDVVRSEIEDVRTRYAKRLSALTKRCSDKEINRAQYLIAVQRLHAKFCTSLQELVSLLESLMSTDFI